MTNIDYVTFPTAKLLKEAGYPQETSLWSYRADGKMTCTDNGSGCCDAPHLYDAMKWLREEKRISVAVLRRNKDNWRTIVDNHSAYYYEPIKRLDNRPTYDQACDFGIATACEWLLGKNHSEKE